MNEAPRHLILELLFYHIILSGYAVPETILILQTKQMVQWMHTLDRSNKNIVHISKGHGTQTLCTGGGVWTNPNYFSRHDTH